MSAAPKLRPDYESRNEWIPAASIEVEPLAQRPFDPKWAKQIADSFDPDLIGFPVVCALPNNRGGERFIALDGWHRIKATMIALGESQSIQCEVIRGITLQRAAKIFRGRNNVRSVCNIDRFLAGVTAGDEECVAITGVVESFDLRVGRTQTDGIIKAVASLQWIYRGERSRGSGRNVLPLRRTLDVVTQAWGKSASGLNGAIIRGIGAVILRHGDMLDFEQLEHRLRQFRGGAAGLLGAGRGVSEAFGGSVANGVATRVVREYNKGRKPTNKLPEWMRGQDDA
jgi:hypothetical protein